MLPSQKKLSLDFSLGLQYTEESPVVITGMSKATQIKRSPVPIVTMNHVAIVENLSTNIIDAIAKLPGVTQLTTGPNVSKPFIRGLGFNRILTLYDGVRQEGQQWGDEHGIEVDQYGVDHAEVIKGPASLTYGSDALAGVVNLIPTPPAPEGKIKGDVLAEFQTNNGLLVVPEWWKEQKMVLNGWVGYRIKKQVIIQTGLTDVFIIPHLMKLMRLCHWDCIALLVIHI